MADLPDYYTQAQISEAEAASFKGGLEANLPAAPVSRDIYLATDKQILYVCIADGVWTGFDAATLTQGILTLYANMVAGGYRLTGLGAPAAQDDALRYGRAEIRNNEIAAAAAIAYSKLNLTGKIKAADIEAAAGIPLSKLVAAVCSETEAAALIAAHNIPLTVAEFQANPATGTTGTPFEINDNNTVTDIEADAIGEYAEVNFGFIRKLSQYRYYGKATHSQDGSFKIEYYDLATDTWRDWVTGISTRLDSWSDWIGGGSIVATDRIRITATALDTGTGSNRTCEVEIKY